MSTASLAHLLISMFVTITNGGAFECERKILVLFVIDITVLMRHTTDIGTELTVTYITENTLDRLF